MQTHCRSVLLFLWAVMLSLLVLSCGGGGGNSTAPPTNPPPVDWEDPTGDPTDNDYELDLDPRAVLNHEPECDTAWARGTERVRPFGNWATYFTMPREDGSVTKQLYAGRTNLVGELFVEIEDDTLTVTYDLDTEHGLDEVHLFVGCSRPLRSAPGQFPYIAEDLDNANTHTFTVDLAADFPDDDCDTLYIAAHAVVCPTDEPPPPCPELAITTDIPNPLIGTPVNVQLEVSGADGPFTFNISAGALPEGLTLSEAGLLSGTITDESLGGQEFTFTVTAHFDLEGQDCTAERTYTITPALEGECPPIPVEITTTELPNATEGTAYEATIEAEGGFGALTFSIVDGELPAGLTLDPDTGTISGTLTDPAQLCSTITFTVMVSDLCPTPATDTQELSITLDPLPCDPLDITTTDLPDAFLNQAYNGTIQFTGGSGDVTIELTSGTLPTGLTLNPDGTITGTATDPEQVGDSFELTFTATDECRCEPQTDTVTVTIIVKELIGCPDDLRFETDQHLPHPVFGEEYFVQIVAAGGVPPYTFELTQFELPDGLVLNPDGTITGTPTDPDDICEMFMFDITVTDSCPDGPQQLTVWFAFVVDAPPCDPIELQNPGPFDAEFGTAFDVQLDVTGGQSPFIFELADGTLPSGLQLTAGGRIFGTPDDENEQGDEFCVTVRITDSCLCEGQSIEVPICINIEEECPPGPEITTTELPDATFNTPYNATIEVTGGFAPLTFEVTSGSLPEGLSIDAATGEITGTPTNPDEQCEDFTFTVTVTDACPDGERSDSATYTITLNPLPCEPLEITTAILDRPVFGEEYNACIETAGGEGDIDFTLVGELPAGIEFDEETGCFSGTPTDPNQMGETFSFTITATDECLCVPQTDEATYTWEGLVCPPCPPGPEITSTDLPDATVGEEYNASVEVTGGVDPLTFEIISGSLPEGLTFNADGTITGTPTNLDEVGDSFCITVRVTDSCICEPQTDEAEFCIVLKCPPCPPGPFITTTEIPNLTFGEPFDFDIEAEGGEGPLTFTLVGGTLPAGLTFDNGNISGTPNDPDEQCEPFEITVRVEDSCICGTQSDEETFQINFNPPVCEPLDIDAGPLANPVQGEEFLATITVNGGEAPFTFEMIAGTLPAGLTFNADGTITGTPTDIEEIGDEFCFTVQVTDDCPCEPQVDTQEFCITLECPPCPPGPEITTTELPNAEFGQPFNGAIEATGGSGDLTFELIGGDLPSGLTFNADGTITGTPDVEDEQCETFEITVRVTDECLCGPQTDEATFTIDFDVEECPTLGVGPEDLPDPNFGEEYLATIVATGGVAPFTFEMIGGELPEGLTFNADGTITGTPTDQGQIGDTFCFTVRVTDDCPCEPQVATREFCIVLKCPPCPPGPFITTTEIPNLTFGEPFDFDIEAEGGEGPLTFTLVGGTLPAGLTFDNGNISGTPNDPDERCEPFEITVRVEDSCICGTQSDEETFQVNFNPPVCEPLDINADDLPNPVFGEPYFAAITVDGGEAPFTFEFNGNLPSGLTFNTDGTITGTPDNQEELDEEFCFSVTVTDSCPCEPQVDTEDFCIILECPPCPEGPEITTTELPNIDFGEPFNATIEATGGAGDLTFELIGGALPEGLTLNPDGTITGTATNEDEQCETFEITVRVTDECLCEPQSDTVTLTLAFNPPDCPPLGIGNTNFPPANIGQEYNASLIATGGVGPFTWEIVAGSLPGGLTLDPDGTISGVPNDPNQVGQTICFTVRVTDSCPCEPQTAERQFCIIVKPNQCPPGPSFVTTELPDANFGEAYDATIEITGGVAPFTFAIIAGTLPAGLSLDPDTGEITGTPTNPNQQCQDFTIRVRVTDSCPFPPRSITRDFTFTVNPEACEPLSIGNTEFPNARLNVAYNATLIAVGGEGPFTWELVSGSLPTGLTVNADGTISGTPTNEDEVGDSFTFTVEVTDSCECEPQTARATFTIELEPEQPGEGCPSDVQFTSPQHLPDACFGEPYFFQLETEGGFGDEDFELTTPPLPSGLTLDEETGIISGTPNDPDEIGDMIMFDVTVTDVCPSDDTEWFVINVVQCGGEG